MDRKSRFCHESVTERAQAERRTPKKEILVTTPSQSYPVRSILLRGLLLPAGLLAWVGVIILALLEAPNEIKVNSVDTLTCVTLAGPH